MRRSPIIRKTPLRPSSRRKSRVGKLGIVRLCGKDMTDLRLACFDRDKGRCQACGKLVYYTPRFPGDPLGYDLAHIKSRGAGGYDALENVHVLCHADHMREHAGVL